MKRVSSDRFRNLRENIIDACASGQGERGDDPSFLKRFLPMGSHARILEPNCMLIVGHRGAGKTELFRALQTPEGRKAIAQVSPRFNQDDLQRTDWCIGYATQGDAFAYPMLFQKFANQKSTDDIQMAWLAYLLRSLHFGSIKLPDQLPQSLFDRSPDIEDLTRLANENLGAWIRILDNLNESLAKKNRFAFIAYDELDRVCPSDWGALAKIVRGLVQFWSVNSRRWSQIRPKIFLRNDIYKNSAIVGPDVSKLSAQRLSLSWSVKDLYSLFFKRLVNHSTKSFQDYFEGTLPSGEERNPVGWLPLPDNENDFRNAINRLCGEFMGASATKGRTFTWIPRHLQDAHGEVLPRSFVKLFEKAAEIENETAKAKDGQLIHHTCLIAALDKVSCDRMEELEEEFEWIKSVRKHLLHLGLQVPIERNIIEQQLDMDKANISKESRPPFTSASDLVQFLEEFGVLYERGDGRIDVRDIYLKGLGFKRKGGVQRPF